MSLTTWARIEPHARTTDLEVGLAAEIADPLWLLLRQVQLGELTGDDGGTPVAIDIAASWSRFSRYRAEGVDRTGPTDRLDATTGLVEALVEAEPVLRLPAAGDPPDRPGTPWTAAVRAGRSLRRRLVAAGLGAVADTLATAAATTFDPPTPDSGAVTGPTERRYTALLAGRTVDGARVLAAHLGGGLPAELLGAADPAAVGAVLDDWAQQLRTDWGVSTGPATDVPPSWAPERLEYAFSLAAPLPGGGERVLQAVAYDGTGVDWYALDADPAGSLGAAADLAADPTLVGSRVSTVLPAPLTYPGMPADRFWEFEDAAVSLGRVGAGPTDLTRMIAVDFALVYGRDWFLAPVEVPVGCVAQVDWVVVRDTFGVGTLVGTTATQAGDGVGRQFQPSQVTGPDGDTPVLVVLLAALAALESLPLEEVALQRDEAADLAWSIEHRVLGPGGRGVDRPWNTSDFDLPPATTPDAHELVWRLATPVAPTWTPLVAVPDPAGARLLRRGRLLDTTTTALVAAQSQLLRGMGDIHTEEVTAAGIRLRLLDQLARTPDGGSVVWRGRERRSWQGEAASGLRFDATTPGG